MIFTDLFENTNRPLPGDRGLNEQRYKFQRIKFRGTNHDIGEERYRFVINGDVIFFNFPSDEDNPDPDSPSFEEILAKVQRSGEVRHYRITPAEQRAIAKKIAAERQRYLDQRRLDVSEGHADQQRKIVKKAGKPVGEVGIDRESSPGAGMYYMKHYASGLDLGGYDSREEALDELRYAIKQGVAEAMKPSDIPPGRRDRLTMRDIEAERPEGAFRFRVIFPDGHANDYMTFDAAQAAAEREKGRITRLSETQKTSHKSSRGTNPRLERILKMLRATHPTAQNDLEALILDFRGQQARDRTDIARLDAENDMEEADIERLEQLVAQLKQRRAVATESLRDGEYHVATVTLDDATTKKVRITSDEGFREGIKRHFEKQGRRVTDIDMDYAVRSELDEAKKKPQPTNPELWGRAKAAARSKFDVWPSAYASAWAAKYYKSKGGGWRMGKAKKKD